MGSCASRPLRASNAATAGADGRLLGVSVQLVIFDCDGVLVDSESISNGVLADLLTAEGMPTTLSEARRAYQGLMLSEVLARAEARLGLALPDDWLATFERE